MTQELVKVLSVKIGAQSFGIRIDCINDIMVREEGTPIPWSGNKVSGVINLRGYVVTLINLHACLGMQGDRSARMNVVIEFNNELYGIICDSVGDILDLDLAAMEPVPSVLEERWEGLAQGIFSLPGDLLILLDPGKIVPAAAPKVAMV